MIEWFKTNHCSHLLKWSYPTLCGAHILESVFSRSLSQGGIHGKHLSDVYLDDVLSEKSSGKWFPISNFQKPSWPSIPRSISFPIPLALEFHKISTKQNKVKHTNKKKQTKHMNKQNVKAVYYIYLVLLFALNPPYTGCLYLRKIGAYTLKHSPEWIYTLPQKWQCDSL